MPTQNQLTKEQEEILSTGIQSVETYLKSDTQNSFLHSPRRLTIVKGLRAFHLICSSYVRTHLDPTSKGSLHLVEAEDLRVKSPFYQSYKKYLSGYGISMPRLHAVREVDYTKIEEDKRQNYVETDSKLLLRYYFIKTDFTVDIELEDGELVFKAKLDYVTQREMFGLLVIPGSGTDENGHWYTLALDSPMLFDQRSKRGGHIQKTPVQEVQIPSSQLSTHHYVAYYWRHAENLPKHHEKVGCAVIKVTASMKESFMVWTDVEFILYYTDQIKPRQYKLLILKPSSAIETSNGVAYLRLEDADTTLSTRAKVLTQITMDVSRADSREWLIGTYSTTHRQPGEPTAGLIVWQKMNSAAECFSKVETTLTKPASVEPVVFQYLANRRVDVPRTDIKSLADLPLLKYVQNLTELAMTYQGYYYNPDKDKVVLFSCTINEVGRVEFNSNKQTHNVHEMHGFVQMIKEAVRVNFDYMADFDTHRLQYNMEKGHTSLGDQRYWIGVYSGFDSLLIKPVSGRVVLQVPKEGIHVDKKDMKLADFKDQWPNSQDILQMLDVLKKQTSDGQYDDDDLQIGSFSFAGVYTCFVMGRDDHNSSILPYRLTINGNGTVMLERKGSIGFGRAEIQQSKNLSIQIEGSNDFAGTLLFSLQKAHSMLAHTNEITHLYGLIAKIKDGHRVEASAAVLVPQRSEDNSKEWFEEIKRNDTSLFARFDEQFNGLLTFLSGQVNRHIRLPLTANRPFRPRKQDYRRVGFYAACNLMQRLDTDEKKRKDQIDHVKNHLLECFYMGFAAQTFAGVILTNELLSDRALKAAFKQHGLTTHNNLRDLRKDLESLLEDRAMLGNALKDVQTMGHSELIEYVNELWSITKPETPDAQSI